MCFHSMDSKAHKNDVNARNRGLPYNNYYSYKGISLPVAGRVHLLSLLLKKTSFNVKEVNHSTLYLSSLNYKELRRYSPYFCVEIYERTQFAEMQFENSIIQLTRNI